MAIKNTTRRALLAGSGSVAAIVTATLTMPVAAAALPQGDDRLLLEMIYRWHQIEAQVSLLLKKIDDLKRRLPTQAWSPDEMAAHRIRANRFGEIDIPRLVSNDEIKLVDEWDRPGSVQLDFSEIVGDGDIRAVTIKSRRPTITAAEMQAWRNRCAGRRALFDQKQRQRDEAKRTFGLESLLKQRDVLCGEQADIEDGIVAWVPRTVAGAAAMLRFGTEWGTTGEQSDEIEYGERVSIRVLEALDRLTGATAVASIDGGRA